MLEVDLNPIEFRHPLAECQMERQSRLVLSLGQEEMQSAA